MFTSNLRTLQSGLSKFRRGSVPMTVAAPLVVLALVLSGPAASASPWGQNLKEHMDNRTTIIFYYRLGTLYKRATNWVRNNAIDPTYLTQYMTKKHDSSDVSVMDLNLNDRQVDGFESCDDAFWSPHCAHSHVHFNNSYVRDMTWQWKTNLACHELGHTIGFNDYDDSTGNSSCTNYARPDRNTYSGHEDTDHIRAHYSESGH